MDKQVLVQSVAEAIEVLGTGVGQKVTSYGESRGLSDRKGIKLGAELHKLDFDPDWLLSPYTQGGNPKPEVVEANEVIRWNGGQFTAFQMYDSTKVLIAKSYLCAADHTLFTTDPSDLKTSLEKAARTIAVREVGSVIGDIRKSILRHIARENEKSDPTAPGSGKSDEVKIGELIVRVIKIAQKAETPEYDATGIVAKAKEILALVGQTLPDSE